MASNPGVLWAANASQSIVASAGNLLLHTTILIAVGLAVARIVQRRNAALASWILRATLCAVLLSPVFSLLERPSGIDDLTWKLSDHFPQSALSAPVSAQQDSLSAAANSMTDDADYLKNAPVLAPPSPVSSGTDGTDRRDLVQSGESTSFAGTAPGRVGGRVPAYAPIARFQRQPRPDADSVERAALLPSGVASRRTAGWVGFLSITLTAIWIVVSTWLLVRLGRAYFCMHRLRRLLEPAGHDVRAVCRSVAGRINVREPSLFVSNHVKSPCLTGILRPAILLPVPEKENTASSEAVITHELAHLARHDCWWNLLGSVLSAAYFFQPLIWLLGRRQEQAADAVCDDFVIEYGVDRRTYAQELLDVASRYAAEWSASPAGVGMMRSQSSLRRRVNRILDRSHRPRLRMRTGAVALTTVLALVMSAAVAQLVVLVDDRDASQQGTQDDAVTSAVAGDRAITIQAQANAAGKQKDIDSEPNSADTNQQAAESDSVATEPASASASRWRLVPARPRGAIWTVGWSPDGKHVAFGESGNIRICNSETLELVRVFAAHTGKITSIAWHPDGAWLASASWDGAVNLWRLDGRPGPSFEGDGAPINTVAWSPDGQLLASGGDNRMVRVWHADGSPGPVFEGHRGPISCVVFSPDGNQLASASYGRSLDRGEVDNGATARIWNLDGSAGPVLRGHSAPIRSVAWSPDGKQLATGGHDQVVRLWSADGTLLNTLPGPERWITHVTYSPDGRWVTAAGRDKIIRLWRADGTFETSIAGHSRDIYQVSWSPDSQRMVSCARDNSVRIFLVDGTPGPVLQGFDNHIDDVAWKPDGKQFAVSGASNRILIFRDDAELDRSIEGFEGAVECAAWSPDGTKLASVGSDRTLRLWDDAGNPTQVFEGHKSTIEQLAWSPDGTKIATAGYHDLTVRVWNVDGDPGPVLEGHRSSVHAVTWSPDGQYVLSGSHDGEIRMWNVDGTLEQSLIGSGGSVYTLSWSSDGSRIVSGGHDGTLRIWNPDGLMESVLRGNAGWYDANLYGGYMLWKTEKAAAWSPDDAQILSGNWSGHVRIWNADGTPARQLAGHTGDIQSVAWSPDGKHFLTCGKDSSVRLWETESAQTIREILILDDNSVVTLDGSGQLVQGKAEIVAAKMLCLITRPDGAVDLLSYPEHQKRLAGRTSGIREAGSQ